MVTIGKGKHFSLGLDLEGLMSLSAPEIMEFSNELQKLLGRILAFPLVTVAAINGRQEYSCSGATECTSIVYLFHRPCICWRGLPGNGAWLQSDEDRERMVLHEWGPYQEKLHCSIHRDIKVSANRMFRCNCLWVVKRCKFVTLYPGSCGEGWTAY